MPIPVVIIQPPLVQLNGPYPSGAYLAAFFRGLSGEFALKPEEAAFIASGNGDVPGPVRWVDASHGFFRHLFSRAGLTLLFSLCRDKALSLADHAAIAGDDAGAETAFQLRRYVSSEDRWIEWIDGIVSILSGGDRERCHSFIRSPHAPRGARMDAFLAGLEAEPSPDDARILATLALEDLADFIATVFDPEFSLVRYAESIASSERNFARVEAALSGPMVSSFLEPYCEILWDGLAPVNPAAGKSPTAPLAKKTLFCLSVPFPGCLVGALAMARSIRERFGDRAVIAMGGGYVNTELRDCENSRLSEYVDILCFDRGFGAFAALFAGGSLSGNAPDSGSGGFTRAFCPPGLEGYESRVTASLVPDYSDIDFSRYPRLADDPNPMHRLWSDGAWIKAFLAHGCYWHRCSFCDVSLDYICGYRPVDVARLYAGLRAQALEKGVLGVHLVDEAAPPRALRDFALENLKAVGGDRLSFWGNIRFEKSFTRDLADFLSAGGLVGVSGGIEIASPEGFKSVDKGIDLENLVACCAAFKEAGVLVHSYLIYGYWNEDEQGVIDAVEVMRQLFAAGLIDSAFWHKFVLTRHSRVFREWERGLHHEGTALSPIDEPGDFADNDLRFRGEEASQRYTAPLDAALNAWMSADGLDTPVRKWFPFPMPAPRIAANLIDGYIASYERKRDHERNRPCDPAARYWWTATRPVLSGAVTTPEGDAQTVSVVWWHLGEEICIDLDRALLGDLFAGLRLDPARPVGEADATVLARLPRAVFKLLRAHGLVRISPL